MKKIALLLIAIILTACSAANKTPIKSNAEDFS